MATRDSLKSPWKERIHLPANFQTEGMDDDIELSSDGREVYLSLDGDIHVIRRVPQQDTAEPEIDPEARAN